MANNNYTEPTLNNEFTADTLDYAKLSNAVYTNGSSIEGWEVLFESAQTSTFTTIDHPFLTGVSSGVTITVEIGFRGVAYINHAKKEIVLAIRGTRITDIKDLGSDALLVLNAFIQAFIPIISDWIKTYLVPQHFDKTLEFYYDLTNREKYKGSEKTYFDYTDNNKYKVTITGHSLGGACAQYLAFCFRSDKNILTETFNAPGVRGIKDIPYSFHSEIANIINHISIPDFIGMMSGHLGLCRFYKRPLRAPLVNHSIETFIEDLENSRSTGIEHYRAKTDEDFYHYNLIRSLQGNPVTGS